MDKTNQGLGLKRRRTRAGIADSELDAYINAERDGFPLSGNLRAGRIFWLRVLALFERQEAWTQLALKTHKRTVCTVQFVATFKD